jgi:hypothetical protein
LIGRSPLAKSEIITKRGKLRIKVYLKIESGLVGVPKFDNTSSQGTTDPKSPTKEGK